MPFTPTHVAAAIPIAWLCRWKLPFSALAIGCMICDTAVFFPGLVDYNVTHSMRGVFTHCLPMGALMYYAYHWFVKEPVGALFPGRIRRFLSRGLKWQPPTTFKHVMLTCALIVMGAASHVFWDSFTHANRWGVQTFSWLSGPVLPDSNGSIRWYAFFQHASSVVLLPPMLIGWLLWVRKQPPSQLDETPQVSAGLQWLAVAVVLLVPASMFYVGMINMSEIPLSRVITISVKRSGAVLICLATIYVCGYSFATRSQTLDRIFGTVDSSPTEEGSSAG